MSRPRINTPALRHTYQLHTLFARARKVGERRYRAACPFHGGKNEQALVISYSGALGWRYHCFNCGADGDVIDATMQLRQMAFREACEFLGGLDELQPPANMHRRKPGLVLVCDHCRNVTLEVEARTYRTMGKHGYEYEVDAVSELVARGEAAGWEMAPDLIAAVCPWCLAGTRPSTKAELLAAVHVATLPCGYDPADVVTGNGPSKRCDLHDPPCH